MNGYEKDGTEIVDIVLYTRDFTSINELLKEVRNITNNLVKDRLHLVGISPKEVNNYDFNVKYKIGKDTLLHDGDFNGKLDIYFAYRIKLVEVEYTSDYVRILVPIKEVDYSKSIGDPLSPNYIPSTIAFIRDYQPQSGYKKDE